MTSSVLLLAVASAQTPRDDPGITVESGAGLRHRTPVHYPKGSPVAGTVQVEASLNVTGEVSDARVLSGPEELRKDALVSVLEWHYSPGTPAPVRILIHFDSSVVSVHSPTRTLPPPSEDFLSGVVGTIEFPGIDAQAESELRGRLPIHEGDPLHHSDFAKITSIVTEFDEHLSADITGTIVAPDAHRELTIRIH